MDSQTTEDMGRSLTRGTNPDLGAKPLSPTERVAAIEVARRVRLDLRALLDALPERDRGASAMSRALGIDRNTCQRLVAATARGDADERTLVQLPGIQGLRQFINAARDRVRVEGVVDMSTSATHSVDRLEALIEKLAGSQRRLRQRLEASVDLSIGESAAPSDDLAARKALFRAAAAVVGRWSESQVTLSMIRPAKGDPSRTESLIVRGHVGHVSRSSAVPLEIGFAVDPRLNCGTRSGENESPLLEAFCSRPTPQISSRTVDGRRVHAIDPAETARVGPCDIVLMDALRSDMHPATRRPALGEVWSLVTFPVQKFVFDVYVHRDIDELCSASIEQHLWSPQIMMQGFWRWSTRFPGGPKLGVLGQGISAAQTSAYARHAELTRHCFDLVGWEANEFVGYRCEVAFPSWRAGFCMLFDFAGHEMPQNGG